MQRIPSSEASGFNRFAAASIGAFATLLLALLPAAAEAGPVAPQVVKPQVVTPTPVTAHVVAPSPPAADPASPAGEADVPAPTTAAPTAAPANAPEAAQSQSESASTPSGYTKPGDKQKELLEELRTAVAFANAITGIPERTPQWSVFDRVMAIVREYFCPRYTWQGATANVENTYEPSCF
jgi:hypothetical protein